MPKYIKRPVVIDAVSVRDALSFAKTWETDEQWLVDAYESGGVLFWPARVIINTLEGVMEGGLDDWIIRGVKGEIYLIKPDIFAETYEAVEDGSS